MGGAAAGSDGAVYGAAVAMDVGGFAGEVESMADGFGEAFAGALCCKGNVTVCAAKMGVGLPVVEVEGFDWGKISLQDAGERLEGFV